MQGGGDEPTYYNSSAFGGGGGYGGDINGPASSTASGMTYPPSHGLTAQTAAGQAPAYVPASYTGAASTDTAYSVQTEKPVAAEAASTAGSINPSATGPYETAALGSMEDPFTVGEPLEDEVDLAAHPQTLSGFVLSFLLGLFVGMISGPAGYFLLMCQDVLHIKYRRRLFFVWGIFFGFFTSAIIFFAMYVAVIRPSISY